MSEAYQEPLLEPTSIRLNLISEVALSADGAARPIHILRVGTFTGQSGVPVTFERADLAAILANFALGKRKRPPITERHDWGRAVGRMVSLYTDPAGDNLYAVPKWGVEGRKLIADEVYDGFSVELDREAELGFTLIGGSLTNYPAVDGLDAVTLSAPPIEEPATEPPMTPAVAVVPLPLADIPTTPQPTTEVTPMSDTTPEQEVLSNVPATLPTALDAYTRQIEERIAAREEAAFARAESEFQRRMQEIEQRGQIEAYARRLTMTSLNQPWALPCTPEELAALFAETPVAARGKWIQLLNRVTASGLVSFDEIGSSGEAAEAADQWATLINAKVAAGMSRVQAIQETSRQHPHLYAAQSTQKRGGR